MNSNKEKIINTAIELFKKNGYDETSINEICKYCGLTKGTFYYHFNSKNEIILNYWEYIFSSVTNVLPELITISDARQKLWKISEYIFDQISSLTASLIKELLILGTQNRFKNFNQLNLVEQEINIEDDWRILMLHKLVTQAQLEGTIDKNKDVEILLKTYAFAIIGVELDWSSNYGNYNAKKILRQIFDIIFC